MKLDARVSKLEIGRRPTTVDYDFSVLDDDELRLIAAVSFDRDGRADLSVMSSANLDQLERVMAKLESAAGIK